MSNERYTRPPKDKERLYEIMGKVIFPLKWGTRTGRLISAILTGVGTFLMLDSIPFYFRLTIALLSPILVEGLTDVSSRLFSETFVGAFVHDKKKNYVWLAICSFIFLGAVGTANIYISTSASGHTAKVSLGEAEQEEADFSNADILETNANTFLEGDTLRIIGKISALKSIERDSLNKIKNKAISRRTELRNHKDFNTEYVQKLIKAQTSKISKQNRELGKISSKYAKMQKDSIGVSISKANQLMILANNKRIEIDTINNNKNQKLLSQHEETVTTWVGISKLVAILGVLSALIWNMYNEVRNAVCGVVRNPKIDTRELKDGLMTRAYEACRGIFLDFFEFRIVEFLEMQQRKNIVKEEERIAKLEAEKEEQRIERQRLLDKAEEEKRMREEKEQQYQHEMEKQRLLYESEREKERKRQENERLRLEADILAKKNKQAELENEREQLLKRIEEEKANSRLRIKPKNEQPEKRTASAESPIKRNKTRKTNRQEIIQMAVLKYPMLDRSEISDWYDSLSNSSDLMSTLRRNFKDKNKQVEKKKQTALSKDEQLIFYTRCCKIDMGSCIIVNEGSNIFIKANGSLGKKKRKEDSEIINDFGFDKIKTA